MEEICNTEQCTGCAACYSSCSHGAISMVVAKDGFLRPVIDKEKCVDCGLCIATCPVNKPAPKTEPIGTYMAWTGNESQRIASSSGGVFPAIATAILQQGGVVFGAAYDEHMNVRHSCIESIDELPLLQSSKYVQSDIHEAYRKTNAFLSQGRRVYFVGTPCQVAGLKNFLRKEYETLLTSDFVCHGCPSNDLFQKQIHAFEERYHSRVKNFSFRSKKRFGQGYDCEFLLDDNRRRFLNAELVPYFYGFWKNITLRDCCYQCQYATTGRVSDITLGDFWTVKRYHKGTKTSKGISLIMANTQKGEEILSAIPELVLIPESLDVAIKSQGHLHHSVKMPTSHQRFMNSYSELSWEELRKSYLTPSTSYQQKMRLRNIVKILTLYKLWK